MLLVVTDGEDTASMDTLEQAVRKVAVDGGPTVYTIGILGTERERRARRALTTLAEQTGGVASSRKGSQRSMRSAARSRTTFAISRSSAISRPTPQRNGGYRSVKVEAHSTASRTYRCAHGAATTQIIQRRAAAVELPRV